MEEYHGTPADKPHDLTGFDPEAQWTARNLVMEIPLFPDLMVRLTKALGFGPHVYMMQHFVYWFHPRHASPRARRGQG